MKAYIHKVKYYETDKMGITHHSNYVRWMEEARIDMLDQIGFGFKKVEELGIGSPVLGYECDIKRSTTFDDEVEIIATCKEYDGVKFIIEYAMNMNGKIIATGKTRHCFINSSGRPVRLPKVCPELDEKLKAEIK
ncbi:MAG: acyl-CoA thioesterase [Clostridia bacterium]|nr:acyl-CoA thioesterase [Clostridia bacterium]